MADADVIITGAGPGGVMAAAILARKGLDVLVLERKPFERVGRPIRVAVERSVFSETGLTEPKPPVRREPAMSTEIISPDGKHKLRVRDLPIISFRMREYMTALVEAAQRAGARFMFETTVSGPAIQSGKVTGVVGSSADGRLLELFAPLTIDASGIHGVLRHGLDDGMGVERQIDPRDVCDLWQATCAVERDLIMDLLERNRIRPQVNVCRFGFMGPYSLFSIYVDLDADAVIVTAGVAREAGVRSAREMVENYVQSHHWIGDFIEGGGGMTPVRRPLDSFVADGLALVGDAACQAIPMHASGVASALLAGKILGEVAAGALSGGGQATRESLWDYNVRYMRSRGAAQANSELFRRFALTLTPDEMSRVFGAGLITGEAVKGALECMPLELPLSSVLSAGRRLMQRPGLVARLAGLSRGPLRALEAYMDYPAEADESALSSWTRKTEKTFVKWKKRVSPASEEESEDASEY